MESVQCRAAEREEQTRMKICQLASMAIMVMLINIIIMVDRGMANTLPHHSPLPLITIFPVVQAMPLDIASGMATALPAITGMIKTVLGKHIN